MHLCAGSNGKNPCFSDKGGPLNVQEQESGLYSVVGVTSGDWACSGPGYPEVFARVTASLDWIQCVTQGAQDTKCVDVTTTTEIPDIETTTKGTHQDTVDTSATTTRRTTTRKTTTT